MPLSTGLPELISVPLTTRTPSAEEPRLGVSARSFLLGASLAEPPAKQERLRALQLLVGGAATGADSASSGVDGLLHVSQLAWGRVNHPNEVLHEGQTIKVSVQSVDKAAKRISLTYRDMLENPWTDVETKYPVNSPVRGKVTKLMEFGAFVELEPGVEGLVHISELAHKRVWRVYRQQRLYLRVRRKKRLRSHQSTPLAPSLTTGLRAEGGRAL